MHWITLLQQNRYAVLLVSINLGFGAYLTWGTLWRHGYFDVIAQLWKVGPWVLPGSDNPILTTFLGIRPLDEVLTFSVILFNHFTDGSSPALSLFAFHFTGQWATILCVVFMEGLRSGYYKSIVSFPVLWLMFMQGATYACGVPVYCLAHLLTSQTATEIDGKYSKHIKIDDIERLKALPVAIIIGYGIPTILMSLRLSNNMLHQWLEGAWQGHPMWILLVQFLIVHFRSQGMFGTLPAKPGTTIASTKVSINTTEQAQACKTVYLFAIGVAAFTHCVSLTIVVVRTLFPSLYSMQANASLTFIKVYGPTLLVNKESIASMPLVVQAFLQYDLYIGSITTAIWALTLYLKSTQLVSGCRQVYWLLLKASGLMIIAGPAAVVPFLLWSRDEEVIKASDFKLE